MTERSQGEQACYARTICRKCKVVIMEYRCIGHNQDTEIDPPDWHMCEDSMIGLPEGFKNKIKKREKEIQRLTRAETIGVRRSIDEKLELAKRNLKLSEALINLIERSKPLKQYHAFVPDAGLFIEFENAIYEAEKALGY